ncbi:hypothetical protein Tco_1262972 [Tanacetum coccineum]
MRLWPSFAGCKQRGPYGVGRFLPGLCSGGGRDDERVMMRTDGEDGEDEDDVRRVGCVGHDVPQVSRPGRYPLRAFPLDLSRATSRPGTIIPATCRRDTAELLVGEQWHACE